PLPPARLLAPHLTSENGPGLLRQAAGRGKRAVEDLLARRYPRPDVVTLVRKLPTPSVPSGVAIPPAMAADGAAPRGIAGVAPAEYLAAAPPQPPAVHLPAGPQPLTIHQPVGPQPLTMPLSAARDPIRSPRRARH